jgi:hypothetical protein
MARVEVESRGARSRAWTYMIVALALIGAIVLVNVVFSNPGAAKHDLDRLFGLPGWALASLMGVLGAVIFWAGLKVEADWPEHLGAFLIAGAVAWGEILVGWNRMEIGGLVVVPYIIPPLVLVVLYIVSMERSV